MVLTLKTLGSPLGSKESILKGINPECHPAYLTYMHSSSCKMSDWMKHTLESRLPGEISVTSDMQMIPPLWQEVKKN